MVKVEVYSKNFCPFCDRAKALLSSKGVEFTEIRVDLDPAQFDVMLSRCPGRRTFPQILIDNQPVGGFDDLWALDQSGQLDEMLGKS